jgi:hypothetical protein
MGKTSLSACFIFWVIFLIVASAPAADLSVYVGGIFPGSAEYQGEKIELENGPVYGFRFSSNFVPSFGMEHTLAFSSDFLFPKNISAISKAKGVIYNSNLILEIPIRIRKAVPYITAGAGFIHQYGDESMPVGTNFAFNYGGGLKFPHLAGPFGLRFDMRGYRAGGFSNKLNIFEVTGGVLFSIGH